MTVDLEKSWLWAYVSSSSEQWQADSVPAGDSNWLTKAQVPWQSYLVRYCFESRKNQRRQIFPCCRRSCKAVCKLIKSVCSLGNGQFAANFYCLLTQLSDFLSIAQS